ncbi:hypothetical protein FOL47_005804 [Perkinsus chesapeaki]|uniref:Uncharacterized protein n=1 Tax=Perkinsus chesapeaki TaxID=330153 RepID=A0A7J6LX12_PERCH|nr:hypothetical protein FOL47_005804 [Perkinsus chesapeaki]
MFVVGRSPMNSNLAVVILITLSLSTGAFPNNFVGTIKTAPDGTESSNKASSLSIDPFSLEQLDGNWWAMDNKANICLEVLNILLTRHRVSTMEDLLTKMCEVYTKAIRAPTARSALPRMRKDEPMDM